jgi:hypothetical protein
MVADPGIADGLAGIGTQVRIMRPAFNDNQGIRYVLAGCLLRQDDYSALKELLAAHEDASAFYASPRS